MKIAAYQFEVTSDIKQNYSEIIKAISMAKEKSVSLIIFPECCLTGYPSRTISKSTDIDFDMVNAYCLKLQKLAEKCEISFVVGMAYKEQNKIFNRAMLFQPDIKCESYDKRALWGYDKENFDEGQNDGIFTVEGLSVGIRICYEIRFPEYFRELYLKGTDINIVLLYDVSDKDDITRYDMIKGHLQTRAVENATTIISVNAISPFQTAPTAVVGKSRQIYAECVRNKTDFIVFDFDKKEDSFGERGIREITDKIMGIKN